MNVFRKSAAGLALGAVLSMTWLMGNSFVRDSQFARAQERVDASRAQIASVQDMATVFKTVGKAVSPSVVSIDVVKTIQTSQLFGGLNNRNRGRLAPDEQPDLENIPNLPQDMPRQFQQQGVGSGVIMETDGDTAYIVTNNHVAGGGGEMTVKLSDGRIIKNAKLVGADPKSDLAVIKIEADRVIPAKWGSSDELEQGDIILAFGSPLSYIGSMTHGIVSAVNRDHVGIISSDFAYENFIQVDAPINPGNSGGPLVNLKGEVVGINTAIATENGGFQGIGFAIPSSQVKTVFTSLKSSGKVARGWLGVGIGDISNPVLAEQVARIAFTGKDGVFVSETFRDTPAYGKLEPDDVVTALNGKKVQTTQALRNQIASMAPGSEVKITVFREGKEQDVTVTLGEQPEERGTFASAQVPRIPRRSNGARPQQSLTESLGVRLSDPTDDLLDRHSLERDTKGAVVTSILPGSPAARAGLRVGDVITRINSATITSSEEASDAFGKADLKKGMQIRVTNRESSRSLFIQSVEMPPQ